MRYFGVDGALEHYLHFTGKALGSIPVAWNNTLNICNQSIYNSKTHYMRMTYNCIKSKSVTYIYIVTRLTRRGLLVEQELLTLPQHMSSTPVLSGVRVTRSLVSYVCFVDRCLSFCTFSFGHCVVCSSSIYGF
jgi:hypothetical protein